MREWGEAGAVASRALSFFRRFVFEKQSIGTDDIEDFCTGSGEILFLYRVCISLIGKDSEKLRLLVLEEQKRRLSRPGGLNLLRLIVVGEKERAADIASSGLGNQALAADILDIKSGFIQRERLGILERPTISGLLLLLGSKADLKDQQVDLDTLDVLSIWAYHPRFKLADLDLFLKIGTDDELRVLCKVMCGARDVWNRACEYPLALFLVFLLQLSGSFKGAQIYHRILEFAVSDLKADYRPDLACVAVFLCFFGCFGDDEAFFRGFGAVVQACSGLEIAEKKEPAEIDYLDVSGLVAILVPNLVDAIGLSGILDIDKGEEWSVLNEDVSACLRICCAACRALEKQISDDVSKYVDVQLFLRSGQMKRLTCGSFILGGREQVNRFLETCILDQIGLVFGIVEIGLVRLWNFIGKESSGLEHVDLLEFLDCWGSWNRAFASRLADVSEQMVSTMRWLIYVSVKVEHKEISQKLCIFRQLTNRALMQLEMNYDFVETVPDFVLAAWRDMWATRSFESAPNFQFGFLDSVIDGEDFLYFLE